MLCLLLCRGVDQQDPLRATSNRSAAEPSIWCKAEARSYHTSVPTYCSNNANTTSTGNTSTARTSRPSHPLHAPCMRHLRYTCVTDRRTIHQEWPCTKVFRAYNVPRGWGSHVRRQDVVWSATLAGGSKLKGLAQRSPIRASC